MTFLRPKACRNCGRPIYFTTHRGKTLPANWPQGGLHKCTTLDPKKPPKGETSHYISRS